MTSGIDNRDDAPPELDDVRAQLEQALGFAPPDEGDTADGGTSDAPRAEPQAFDAMFASVERDVARERGVLAWLRSARTSSRALLGLLAVLAVAAVGLATRRVDLPVYPKLRLALELALPLLLIALGLAAWLRPLHKPARSTALDPLIFGLLLLVPLGIALLPTPHAAHPASLAGAGADLVKRVMGCLIFGTALGLPAGLFFVALGRASHGGAIGALSGGAVGALGVHLHCPITGQLHLLLGHATIPAAAAAVALAVVAVARRVGRRTE